ncbi:MAG: hypothetical protein J6S49_05100 [Erysipelotrichaceae bacterium]|nr:hypothetical protein [Erysipelotrichaceae bacterium]
MKDSTKMMRLVMEEMKMRLIKCERKNVPSWYDQDKELMSKIQSIGDTISFFERQQEGMKELATTSTHKAYINKIKSWIQELEDLRSECIRELEDRRSAQGGE